MNFMNEGMNYYNVPTILIYSYIFINLVLCVFIYVCVCVSCAGKMSRNEELS